MKRGAYLMMVATCRAKQRFHSAAAAMRSVDKMGMTRGYRKKTLKKSIKPYRCLICTQYHLTGMLEEVPAFFKNRK